ncbi:MAG: sensor histidine kinase [Propionibacteriaceae bacterium]
MPSMSEVIAEHTELTEADHDRLTALVAEWQLLADLSFSDLVLWVPEADPNVFWAAAQIRPTTGPTSLVDDVVGDLIAYSPEHLVSEAFMSGKITETSEGKLQAGIPVGVHAIPITIDGRLIAVVEQHSNQLGVRTAGSLEQSYLQTAAELAHMMSVGAFPPTADVGAHRVQLRIGDGFVRLDPDGDVLYASPNALSAYRRLGLAADLVDSHLESITRELIPASNEPIEYPLEGVLSGRRARRAELVVGDAHLLVRSLPLDRDGTHLGAIVLLRDVTDLRHRERQLVSKDATIREIHHRVKNNLQTVAALLRMQARRIDAPEAKSALHEAMSRVAAIAIVHETLSQVFDEVVEFDKVADQLLRMVGDVALASGRVTARRVGSFGQVSASVATNLSLVLTEICQNAVEHGLAHGRVSVGVDGPDEPGEVIVRATSEVTSDGRRLLLEVLDNGFGLPDGFSVTGSSSLGLSIVRTLVAELGGHFEIGPNPAGVGTRAAVNIPL